jgi:hypothetical protein
MRSSVDGATCPGFRLRAVTTKVTDSGGGTWIPDFLSQDLNSELQVNYFTPDFVHVPGREPGTAGDTYDILSWPQQVESLMNTTTITYLAGDLLDLDKSFTDDAGTIFIDQVDIDCLGRPAPGTGTQIDALTFGPGQPNDFSGWTADVGPISGGTLVAPTWNNTATELVLNVQPGAQFYDAASVSPAVALTAGDYYRVIYQVSSSAMPGGDFGPTFRNGFVSADIFVYSADKQLQGGGLLTAIGSTPEPYEVWTQAPPVAAGETQTEPIQLRFQSWLGNSNTGFPFNKNVSGTIRVHEAVTEQFPGMQNQ